MNRTCSLNNGKFNMPSLISLYKSKIQTILTVNISEPSYTNTIDPANTCPINNIYNPDYNRLACIKTIKRSIKMLRGNTTATRPLIVGFYSQELQRDLGPLRELVAYCQETLTDRTIIYVLASGSLITSEKALRFLDRKGFYLIFELNISKVIDQTNYEIADDGDYNLYSLMKNLLEIKINHWNLFSKLTINLLFNPEQDILKFKDLFDNNPILSKNRIIYTMVDDNYVSGDAKRCLDKLKYCLLHDNLTPISRG